MTIEEKYNQIIAFIKQYTEETNAKGYVLGISGGKDSTIVTKLLVDAVGADKVVGIMMPNGLQKDIEDSQTVCKILGINSIVVNIEYICNSLIRSIETISLQESSKTGERIVDKIDHLFIIGDKLCRVSDKSKTNIPPRERMTVLYTVAQTLGYRVAGTGNKSEAFIGWCTKWGDMACDINPIAHLTCSEVVELGDYLGLPKNLVHKHPADGLTGKSDEENFGFTYAELDTLIKKQEELVTTGKLSSPYTETELKILKMHDNAYHKDHVINIYNYGKR